ncbi:hypothetical protein SDC9_110333 [bioreactor metagenome]|uniref:Uncharacterized protein n=1 Tax=bioreactor metagenome TaxID=1076179 RepID=A0A645BJQ6_9ZZZZ
MMDSLGIGRDGCGGFDQHVAEQAAVKIDDRDLNDLVVFIYPGGLCIDIHRFLFNYLTRHLNGMFFRIVGCVEHCFPRSGLVPLVNIIYEHGEIGCFNC